METEQVSRMKKKELLFCDCCREYKEEVVLYVDIAGDPYDQDMKLCRSCAIEKGVS